MAVEEQLEMQEWQKNLNIPSTKKLSHKIQDRPNNLGAIFGALHPTKFYMLFVMLSFCKCRPIFDVYVVKPT